MKVISVGKKHESWVKDGIERYEKRLKKPYAFDWILLPHSSREGTSAREEGSQSILSRLDRHDFVVLLDEQGVNLNSPALSRLIEEKLLHAQQIVFVIGGAYGVNQPLHDRAEMVWSLSRLVFPHQLVRLILTEQLYRAQEIARGGNYHHE